MLKRLSKDVRTFSAIENLILRTFHFSSFLKEFGKLRSPFGGLNRDSRGSQGRSLPWDLQGSQQTAARQADGRAG